MLLCGKEREKKHADEESKSYLSVCVCVCGCVFGCVLCKYILCVNLWGANQAE